MHYENGLPCLEIRRYGGGGARRGGGGGKIADEGERSNANLEATNCAVGDDRILSPYGRK